MALRALLPEYEEPERIDVTRAQALQNIIGNFIEADDFSKVEVIAACLTIIGQQYAGRALEKDELTNFIIEGATWCKEWWG